MEVDMNASKFTLRLCLAVLTFLVPLSISYSLNTQIRPVSLQKPMPDFTLPVYQGEPLTLSHLKGKNILLIFPRGLAGKDHWCHVCNYQYVELAELEKKHRIREKYRLEILFVLPYSQEMVKEWVEKFPEQLKDIENWKNPESAEKLDERGKRRLKMVRDNFPNHYSYEPGQVPLLFPILIDSERTVSKGLGIFTLNWGGSQIEQNIPTVYLIDRKGVVQFKYMSQNTFDRPSPDYLLNFLSRMNQQH